MNRPIFLAIALAALASPALGQQAAPDSATADSSTIVYGQEFFSQYSVTNAEDILRRIPGVPAILDAGDSNQGQATRGFGSGGDQILINGRRLAGKSNEISSALRRIQVQNLDRVELLRGTSSDIDVRSDGVVVNIILKEGGATSKSGSAKLATHFNEYDWFDVDGAASFNSEAGKLTYFLSLENNSLTTDQRGGFSERHRDEHYYYPTGEVMQDRATVSTRELEEYTLAANSGYSFDSGDRLQLNLLIKPSEIRELDTTPFTAYDINGIVTESAVDQRGRTVDRQLEWEFGGNYERGIGDGNNLKLLWVYNHNDTPSEDFRNQLDGDVRSEISRNPSDVLETEAILRGSYFWSATASQSLEFGAEVAKNTLEQVIEVYFDLDGDGVAEKIDIFDPSSKVEEVRTEVFANHNWTLNSRWTAASSLVAEASEITQSGVDIENSTSFSFLKPRLDVRYSPNDVDQYRFRLERTVSQLDFGNFVPRYDLRQDRFTAGNPDLRPETAWEYEIAFERRLADDQGVLDARVYYNDIHDRIESVAIDLDGDGTFDPATGNIGDAVEYGWEVGFSLRMSRFGVPDLIVNGSYLWRESEVTDPFTGLDRKMATDADYVAKLGLRHDIAGRGLSYGFNYSHNGGTNVRSEWQEYRWFQRKEEIDAFLEMRFGTRWTFRFDALGLTRNERTRNRLIFADGASNGTISRREAYDELRDRRYSFSLTRTF